MSHAHCTLETPLGRYRLEASRAGLTRLQPAAACGPSAAHPRADPDAKAHLALAARAVAEYFAGRRRDFADLPLAPAGTAFQQSVWAALRAIPFGATASYGEIARRVGDSTAARAVGSANHDNPLAILVPCHRVIGRGGELTGYAGGLERKRWLLRHEGALLL